MHGYDYICFEARERSARREREAAAERAIRPARRRRRRRRVQVGALVPGRVRVHTES